MGKKRGSQSRDGGDGRAAGRWENEKKRRCSHLARTSGGLSSIIYGNMSHECSPSQTTLSTASEIRPRFGKAASGFIFLPFVLASANFRVRAYTWICVHMCVCSASLLSRIEEKRGRDSALLSALCSTGFLLERGKDASCLKPGTLFEHVLSSTSISLLRRGTSNDTFK